MYDLLHVVNVNSLEVADNEILGGDSCPPLGRGFKLSGVPERWIRMSHLSCPIEDRTRLRVGTFARFGPLAVVRCGLKPIGDGGPSALVVRWA